MRVRISSLRQHLVEARPLHIQDLAAQGQDGLEATVAALLGRTAGASRLRRCRVRSVAGSRSEQSASLPGRVEPRARLCGRTSSRALRAASRARAAFRHFSRMRLPSAGFSSRNCASASPSDLIDLHSTSALLSLPLVWPSNCGFGQLDADDGRQALAHIVAGEVRLVLFEDVCLRPYSFSVRVSAERKPVTCEPPSTVLMPLAKEKSVSLKLSLYCSATSTSVSSILRSTCSGRCCTTLRFLLRWRRRNAGRPRSSTSPRCRRAHLSYRS